VKLVDAAGSAASAESLYDRALTALADGDLRDAEDSLGRARERDRDDLSPLFSFLAGDIAYARAQVAGRQAATPEAEPFAFDVAIQYASSARDAFAAAAASREDWPAARRNVERALRLLADLARQKAEKQNPPKRRPEPQPEPKPLPPPEGPGQKQEVPAEAQLSTLSPEEVRRLLDLLAEKEREKLATRRKHRAEKMAGAEKDW
jgi:hypothetical protein